MIGAPGGVAHALVASETQYAIALYCNGFMLGEGRVNRQDDTVLEYGHRRVRVAAVLIVASAAANQRRAQQRARTKYELPATDSAP